MGDDVQVLINGLPDDVALDCLARVPHQYHAGLRPVCRRWRDLIAAPFFRRRREMIGAAEDLVFMVQALVPAAEAGNVEGDVKEEQGKRSRPPIYALGVYNATLGSWHRVPAAVPMFAQCVAVGGRLVLVGGWDPATLDPVADVAVLDIARWRWTRGRQMSTARSFFACAAGGGRVYVAGGHDGQKNALRSAEVYDVERDEWAALPEMGEERDECKGVVGPDGRFWAVSGYGTEGQGVFGTSAECYDPAAGEWSREEGVVAGAAGAGAPSAAFFAAPEIGVWCVDCGEREVRELGGRVVGPVPEALKSSPCAAAMGGAGRRVFVMGSVGAGGNGAWVVEAASGKWSQVEPPPPPGFAGFVYSAAAVRL